MKTIKNYKMIIEYDGTRYNGWQKQGNSENTIQQKIEDVLFKMTEKAIEINGSGRTDAGTHALGQTANFHTDSEMNCDEMVKYFNKYLPKDIAVTDIQEADNRFHARLNAKGKKYIYRIWNSSVHNVFERNYLFSYDNELDVDAMKKAASFLVGQHDFKAFSSIKKNKKSTVREIYSIDISKKGDEISFLFYGNGFLYNMIRIIVGTLIDVGEGKIQPESINGILESCSRENAGKTMPSCGLTLLEVLY